MSKVGSPEVAFVLDLRSHYTGPLGSASKLSGNALQGAAVVNSDSRKSGWGEYRLMGRHSWMRSSEMPLAKHFSCILAAIVASVAGMVTGITQDLPGFTGIAAGLFAVALIASAVEMNSGFWRLGSFGPSDEAAVEAAIRNSRLLALGYLWGALALFMSYKLTPLRWQHGLQYGAGMALIAWFIQFYVHFLVQPDSRLRTPEALTKAMWLSVLHGAAALGGLAFLLLSGKINSIKDDWAANHVFLAGGLAIVALSFVSAYTHTRLSSAPHARRESVAEVRND